MIRNQSYAKNVTRRSSVAEVYIELHDYI